MIPTIDVTYIQATDGTVARDHLNKIIMTDVAYAFKPCDSSATYLRFIKDIGASPNIALLYLGQSVSRSRVVYHFPFLYLDKSTA